MLKQKKIVLAEDNLADVELTKIAFSESPIPLDIVHVSDGQALLDYLKDEPLGNIALILLDLNIVQLSAF